MKKKYILIGILAKVAYDKFMAQTEFGKKWRMLWSEDWFKHMRNDLFDRKVSFKKFEDLWRVVWTK